MYRKKSEVIIYAAFANNQLIERDGIIPWKYDPLCRDLVKEDVKRLRSSIKGSSVIIGRKTYENISKVLIDPIANIWEAQVLVMSSNNNFKTHHSLARVVHSLDEALDQAVTQKISVLGGVQIYQQVLARNRLVDRMELTIINRDYGSKGKKFPLFNSNEWNRYIPERRKTLSGINYRFIRYERTK